MAIEGVQPQTRFNPTPAEAAAITGGASSGVGKKKTEDKTLGGAQVVRPIVKHSLSRELQLYYEKITQAISGVSFERKSLSQLFYTNARKPPRKEPRDKETV